MPTPLAARHHSQCISRHTESAFNRTALFRRAVLASLYLKVECGKGNNLSKQIPRIGDDRHRRESRNSEGFHEKPIQCSVRFDRARSGGGVPTSNQTER
jgi:hypothetical protein